MFCVHCGKQLVDGFSFCPKCGARIHAAASPVNTETDHAAKQEQTAHVEKLSAVELEDISTEQIFDTEAATACTAERTNNVNVRDNSRIESDSPKSVFTKKDDSCARDINKKFIRFELIFILVVIAITVVFLAISLYVDKDCVGDEQIHKDVRESCELDENGYTITSYTEERRSTDLKEGEDRVWTTICADNGVLEYQRTYKAEYYFEDDGWELDSIEMVHEERIIIAGVTQEQVINDLWAEHGSLVSQYDLKNVQITVKIPEFDPSSSFYVVNCFFTAENQLMEVEGQIMAQYRIGETLEDSTWRCCSSRFFRRDYWPKEGPSESLLNNITSQWAGMVELDSYTMQDQNHADYVFFQYDDTAEGIEIVWKNCVSISFSPDRGGWAVTSQSHDIEGFEFALEGEWKYESGREHLIIEVNSADVQGISYDIDLAIVPSNLLNATNQLKTGTGEGLERDWTWEYDQDQQCIIFTTTKPVFTDSYIGGSYTFEYYLHYKAFANEQYGQSGFYLYDCILTRTTQ